ncbi:MAG: transmembrane proteins 14C-domain-containing protein [Benjaminiella poitrasii]|nr:MAG: transmembrane proteins 14C-domain-containing protein [Benjaminiella poitrasii]
MSHHPSYAMTALCTAGGIAGYARSRSVPSLVAGVGVGAMYGVASYLIKENKYYGHETGVAASIVLASSMAPKAIRTRKPIPVTFAICSVATGIYYSKKIVEYW